MVELDEMRTAILTALATMEEPAGCGEIAKKADLPTPKVVGKMRGLLKDGLVKRPVKGKYVISDVGREALG
ncbi:MAG: helix-turn-helix domain-containing protein [Candidatus Bipolaricaulia bacterium]